MTIHDTPVSRRINVRVTPGEYRAILRQKESKHESQSNLVRRLLRLAVATLAAKSSEVPNAEVSR